MDKRKDGRWRQTLKVQRPDGSYVTKQIYGKTKSEVLRKIAELKLDEETKPKGASFEFCAEGWWEEAELQLAENSKKNYRPAKERAIAHFGKTSIPAIRPADINRFMAAFIKEQRPADKTARTQLMIINLICKWAVRYGYLESNPARDLEVPKGMPKQKRDMPPSEQLRRIKASWNLPFGMFAYWALYTGARRGELLALTWEDVDLERRSIEINKSLYFENGHPKIKPPKTEKGRRTLPLMDKLFEKITPGAGLIFPGPDGSYMTEGQFITRWNAYKKAAGVDIVPHQLRHAYATMLFEAKVSESDAQELLGHAQIGTTKDIYTTIREEHKATIREGLLGIDIG